VASCDVKYRELRDEYKKAELLFTHLEVKYRELVSHHYSFKDTARRLANMRLPVAPDSDSERHEEFNFGNGGTGQMPLDGNGPSVISKDAF
jgi:hypothetical protein